LTLLTNLDKVDVKGGLQDVEWLAKTSAAAQSFRRERSPESRSSDLGQHEVGSECIDLEASASECRLPSPAVGSGDGDSDAMVRNVTASHVVTTWTEDIEKRISARRVRPAADVLKFTKDLTVDASQSEECEEEDCERLHSGFDW